MLQLEIICLILEKLLLWMDFSEMFRKCWKLAKAQQSGISPKWNAIPLIFKF